MLTPKFSLSQDAVFVYIHITAPYIKLEESECYVHENEFYFHSQPYYLRLHLPGNIIENELSTSKYDVDSGQLTVRFAKETKGEVFEGLDLLTKLLTHNKVANHNIEVVSDTNEQSGSSSIDENKIAELEFDWFIEQNINETPCPSLTDGPGYGFAKRKSNILNELVKGFPELLDLKDPDNVPVSQRRNLREKQEKEQFNCEHYLADLFDDEIIEEVISSNFPELTGIVEIETIFTELDTEKLLQLPRREYIIDDSDLKAVYLGLVDLVFAYAYNFRFTKGEHNVESDWTICKLSATLSWLDIFENLDNVVISCARRSLCFPLYRSWKLFNRVFDDVKTIFLTGKSQVLKCLLGIHRVLAESDSRYVLNDLYITDYCVWLQHADSKKITSIAKALKEVKIYKSELGLSLDEMEADARKLMDGCTDKTCSDDENGEEIEKLACALSDIVKVKDTTIVDSDDDSEDEDEGNSEDSNNSEDDDEYSTDASDTDNNSNSDAPENIDDQVSDKDTSVRL